MSDQLKEFADVPRDFLKEGTQFLNRCTKRELFQRHSDAELCADM